MPLLWGALLVFLTAPCAFAHDHWISRGHYLDPITKAHCCTSDDCKVIPDREIPARIRREGDFLIVDGFRFHRRHVHKSEDGLWYRCLGRCLFGPFDN